ncbi:MAG: hypothetical protein A3H96_05520 [Acidobacteria bacterium RIFCSPLOWO2_02_FULL_67_36]|nr:MAG: hypothetical protein A3H96_05520 [Acidobacteria bacterium RIFCSPLOWO2_02_FULL_67_36]OFW21699.1 MAG: hypothetical protein A3G21_15005 [Acidobacteria bacterium RIFCSPLOWO2_12_FULL_66_21]
MSTRTKLELTWIGDAPPTSKPVRVRVCGRPASGVFSFRRACFARRPLDSRGELGDESVNPADVATAPLGEEAHGGS